MVKTALVVRDFLSSAYLDLSITSYNYKLPREKCLSSFFYKNAKLLILCIVRQSMSDTRSLSRRYSSCRYSNHRSSRSFAAPVQVGAHHLCR